MTLLLVATTLLTLLFLFGAPATLLLMRLREGPRPSALPRAEAPPADVVGELGFVREGPGRYRLASETGPPVELEGLEVGGVLQHVHGMAVQGGWGELSVTPGTVPSQETGDVAFDRAHVVRGTALYLLDDAVRAAFLAPSSARRTLVDGRLMVAPAPEIDLAHALSLLRQLQQALDAAPGSDSALARDVAQDGAVRAEALRRSRAPALIADLEDDPDPVVRLLALLLGQPVDVERLAALAADGSAPAEVRQRAAAALPSLPDELLDAMIESEEPVLWSLVAKAAGGPKQRVERLGRLLRPGPSTRGAGPRTTGSPTWGRGWRWRSPRRRHPTARRCCCGSSRCRTRGCGCRRYGPWVGWARGRAWTSCGVGWRTTTCGSDGRRGGSSPSWRALPAEASASRQ